MGCLGIIILLVVIAWIADVAGCNSTTTQDTGPHLMSKAEWRQKYAANFGQNPIITVAKFKAVFGEPSSSQTVDATSYWYYECSDGSIQVVVNNPSMFGNGACVQSINDY